MADEYLQYEDSCSGVWPDDSFEGLLEERWPNGNLKFRGLYKKGQKRIGQHLSFWENGALKEVSYWDNGWASGTVIWFMEDGTKECEKDYGDTGSQTRSWVERDYDENGTLAGVTVRHNDRIVAEWTRPDLRELYDEIGMDNIVADAVKKFFPEYD